MLCDNGYGLNIYVFVETGYIIHAPPSSLSSCFRTPFFCKTRIATYNVSANYNLNGRKVLL